MANVSDSGCCAGECGRHVSQFEPRYPHFVLSEGVNPVRIAVLCKSDFDGLPEPEKVGWRRIDAPASPPG